MSLLTKYLVFFEDDVSNEVFVKKFENKDDADAYAATKNMPRWSSYAISNVGKQAVYFVKKVRPWHSEWDEYLTNTGEVKTEDDAE